MSGVLLITGIVMVFTRATDVVRARAHQKVVRMFGRQPCVYATTTTMHMKSDVAAMVASPPQ